MSKEYVHDLKAEVSSISGSYELEKEGRIEVEEKAILYAVGHAVVSSACCGAWG